MTRTIAAWSADEGATRATELFETVLGGSPDGVWAAPGRVNLIGEHVDYNGGLCLPMALPHATFAAARRRDDGVVRVVSGLDRGAVFEGTVASIAPGKVPGWVAYAAGPLWAMLSEGLDVGGFDLAVESSVPIGAGLSSSAAVECATALALDELNGLGLAAQGDAGRARLAALCVRAENEVAGAPTGGMDQATALRASEGHALLLDTRDSSVRLIPCDLAADALELLVIDTRAKHALGDGQYGSRRAACESAAAQLGVATLREVDDLGAALAALADPAERSAVRHVVTEIQRVRDFAALLETGRVRETGPLLDASHASLRDDFAVSCDELDVAVASAKSAGALGGRMVGGGFGGSAIALIPAGTSGAVSDAVVAAFVERRWAAPQFLTAIAGPAGRRVR